MIMAFSQNLSDLIANFISVAIVIQCDSLLATSLKWENPDKHYYQHHLTDADGPLKGKERKDKRERVKRGRAFLAAFFAGALYTFTSMAWGDYCQ